MSESKPVASRVLGVDPGCRYLGSAVMEGRELIHHAVDDVAGDTGEATIRRAELVVGRLVDAYEPELIVVERAFFSRGPQAPLLRRVTDAVLAIGVRRSVRTHSVAPSSLKKHATGDGHASKAEVSKALCRHHPELRLYLGASRKWKARVHSNRFDAIALARMGTALRPCETTGPDNPGPVMARAP